jgi:hypothetical protein
MKKNDDILKAIRKVRKKHYEETKHMSMTERMEYYRKNSESFREELSRIDINDGKYEFPFIHHKKSSEKENNTN